MNSLFFPLLINFYQQCFIQFQLEIWNWKLHFLINVSEKSLRGLPEFSRPIRQFVRSSNRWWTNRVFWDFFVYGISKKLSCFNCMAISSLKRKFSSLSNYAVEMITRRQINLLQFLPEIKFLHWAAYILYSNWNNWIRYVKPPCWLWGSKLRGGICVLNHREAVKYFL